MPKKRKLRSLDDKCRVCLSDEGCMSDIFCSDLKLKIEDLGKSTSIDIEDDETFPRNICHVCLYKLDMWIDFKKQFIRSNNILRDHLELGLLSDNKASLAKRRHSELQICVENITDKQDNAELKSEASTPPPVKSARLKLGSAKENSLNEKKESIKNSQNEVPESVNPAGAKDDSEMTSDVIPVASTVSPKVKQIVGRRAKTTERRKESTRRWVARKKALLAATGENDTDTDSMVSDDDQLSPVQKARAKCNAEKVAESHRRMTRALHNLDSNISGNYGTNADSGSCVIQDSETEVQKAKTKCVKSEKSGNGSAEVRPTSKNVPILPKITNIESLKNSPTVANNFVPHSVRSELIVDGATFFVTSTLVLAEPHYLNPGNSNNSSLPADDLNQERNTDIIDAVQLRRVCPTNSQTKNESKFVDTCLNIEVEGTELDALQRVQAELANFVERDMKVRLSNANSDGKSGDGFQTLDQQLKTIVEKTIKKNLENSRIIDNRGNNTFTGEFLKAALRSKIFQPRVLLARFDKPKRLDPLKQRTKKRKPIVKNIQKKITRSLSKKIEDIPAPLGKRRSVQPAKYADYNTSPFDSGSEDKIVNERPKPPSSGPKSSKVKTYGPAPPKIATSVPTQQKPQPCLLVAAKTTPNVEGESNNAVEPPIADEKPESVTQTPVTVPVHSTSEKHICGVCGESFGSRNDIETHFVTHKKQAKQKMMRCKRCHEIVDARYVKMHVCSASKNSHKCQTCDAAFRTEQLLAKHAESHESIKEDTVNKIEIEAEKNAEEIAECSKIPASNEKHVTFQVGTDNKDSYTCFVCDKTFTDEELLKDHLQKHCDDMSEDERSNVKEYQCAICGESLESEDTLETHVEKHLFDDEDDNPNLISIEAGVSDEKNLNTELLHKCGQCSESFDSEMLLMLHMQAHEEEVAIAEWERRGVDNSQEEQHICVICDDLFATEDELSEHLDVHNGNPQICLLCDKPFLTIEELQCHVNTH